MFHLISGIPSSLVIFQKKLRFLFLRSMTLLFYIKREESIVTSQLVSGLEGRLSQVHISCHAFPEFHPDLCPLPKRSAPLVRWFGVPMMKGHRMEKVAQSAPWSGSIEVVPMKQGYELAPSGLSLRVSLTIGDSVWTLIQLLNLPLNAFQWAFNFLFLNEKCMFPEELALGPRFSAWKLLETGLSGKNKNRDCRLGKNIVGGLAKIIIKRPRQRAQLVHGWGWALMCVALRAKCPLWFFNCTFEWTTSLIKPWKLVKSRPGKNAWLKEYGNSLVYLSYSSGECYPFYSLFFFLLEYS